ncbi:hypothetical protein [Lentzea sp. NBRC 102530]|uniref:hypothetical protein n=1 Tax=Lentzea sp. NBRC 102530 TaxID=3032201 RepID=UPI0024A394F8|nr:hypothetical protein [Lentzea sp. NBRC 102530]GLY48332.1 hypothetical protein Lesp01_19880 [Lentzea sp. NBRC 102530]
MPGQKKRKDRQAALDCRAAARTAPGTGEWVVRFETQDHREFRDHMRRLEVERPPDFDPELSRIDTFCGRETHPTTCRLSVFVPQAK